MEKAGRFFWKHKLFFKSEVKPADFSTIENKFSKPRKMHIKSRGVSSSRWKKIRMSWILSVSVKSTVHSWKFSMFHKRLSQKNKSPWFSIPTIWTTLKVMTTLSLRLLQLLIQLWTLFQACIIFSVYSWHYWPEAALYASKTIYFFRPVSAVGKVLLPRSFSAL